MIPVVAPPLDERPTRTKRFRARQYRKRDAPPDQLPRPTDDRRTPSRWLSRHRPDRNRGPRTPAPTVLIGLSAAAVLAAAMIRRRYERAPH